jgi:hypothetical protein
MGEHQHTFSSHGLVRDPAFWRRFSAAVHLNEDVKLERGFPSVSSTEDGKYGYVCCSFYYLKVVWGREVLELSLICGYRDQWLAMQYKEKRKCRAMCVAITLVVMIVIAAVVSVGYYFLKVRK